MHGFPFVVRFPMHWSDMDALGHANNARYFTWFESARVAWFQALDGLAHLPPGVGPVLASTSCTYHRPLVYPAELAVGVRVARVGRASVHMEMAVARADAPDEPVAEGTAVVVMVSYQSGRPVPVPDDLRAAMRAGAAPA